MMADDVDITEIMGRMRGRGIARPQLRPKKESVGFINDVLQGGRQDSSMAKDACCQG